MATSATLADPSGGQEPARTFATRFFGVERDQVEIVSEEYARDDWSTARRVPPAPATAKTRAEECAIRRGDVYCPKQERRFMSICRTMTAA